VVLPIEALLLVLASVLDAVPPLPPVLTSSPPQAAKDASATRAPEFKRKGLAIIFDCSVTLAAVEEAKGAVAATGREGALRTMRGASEIRPQRPIGCPAESAGAPFSL
jgi:hypothetical protein